MEGLLSLAQDFLRDQAARARAFEVDRAREPRLPQVRSWLEAFGRGELELQDLMAGLSSTVREMTLVRGVPLALWGFKNDDERAFPERLAQAAARVPEVDLKGVLRHLLTDCDGASDDERVNRLLAFADFVADLDSRGAEGDPRLGVGPSANFLTFLWHIITYGREAVFLFDSNKAIKAVAEASQDPTLQAKDLEGRFRAFYLVARRLAGAVLGAQPPMRPGWAIEHVLEYVLERTGAVAVVAGALGAEDAATSGLWRPRPRDELRLKPPSGRMPSLQRAPLIAPATPSPTPSSRGTVTIERPRAKSGEAPESSSSEKKVEDRKSLEEKKGDEKKLDLDKKADDKRADDKKSDDKKVEEKKHGATAPTSGEAEKKAPDKKAPDKKAPDKNAEDKKADDKKADDKKADDKKADDKKADDKLERAEPPRTETPPRSERPIGLKQSRTIVVTDMAPASAPAEPVQRAPEPREIVATKALPKLGTRPPAPHSEIGSAPTPPTPLPRPAPADTTKTATPPEAAKPASADTTKTATPPEAAKPAVSVDTTKPATPPGTTKTAAPPETAKPASPLPAVAASTETAESAARGGSHRQSKQISAQLMEQALGELIGEIATAEAGPEEALEDQEEDETWRSNRLARDLSVDEGFLAEVLDALALRGRVVLVGPLATGKTYVARRIALHVASREERMLVVRGHPGLSYEDLVESKRPDGTCESGLVRELLERARREREDRFALVIDDADRADLARALGELLPALSERADVLLPRSRTSLAMPKNLIVIATARSVPPELLGRFPIVEAAPDEEGLRRYLQRTRPALAWAADLLKEANARIGRERGPAARIGHGILMHPDLDLTSLEGIWRREVLPIARALGLDARALEIGALRASSP